MRIYLLMLIFLLHGCSNIPSKIRNAPNPDVHFSEVYNAGNYDRNDYVRWGGSIIEVENEENSSLIQILYYPLERSGRPKLNKTPEGRFAIKSPKFLDPAIYRSESQITVTGTIDGSTSRMIGQKKLILPVISVDEIYLWPNDTNRNCSNYRDYPFFYNYYYPYGFYGGFYPRFYGNCF